MADYNLSSNMSLPIPTVGVDSGPDWASNLNACLTIVDGHTHSAGSGVAITPSGININTDFPYNNYNATNVKSLRFYSQSAVLSGGSDLGCLYEVSNDLYFNDGVGNQIRMTQSGAVAGTPGSIASLASPATATYVSANQTFVWQSAALTPANLDAGSVIIRNVTASSKGITLSAPNALASNFSLILPTLPAQQNAMTLDASGNISSVTWDTLAANMTATGTSSLVATMTSGNADTIAGKFSITGTGSIASTMTAANTDTIGGKMTSTGSNAISVVRTRATGSSVGTGGIAIGASSGSFNTMSTSYVTVTGTGVTIVTSGRPVQVMIIPVATGANAFLGSNTTAGGLLQFTRDASAICTFSFNNNSLPPGGFQMIDGPSAASHVYGIQVLSNDGTAIISVTQCRLAAYEL